MYHQLVYGASDDLLELEGYIEDEFPVHDRTTIEFTTKSEHKIWITATFCNDPDLKDQEWVLAVKSPANDPWPYPIRFDQRPGVDCDPAIALSLPIGTTVRNLNAENEDD